MANVTVTAPLSNVNVDINTSTVTVAATTTNVNVSSTATTNNADIRAAIGNTAPILYDTTTGIISIDQNAILTETFVDSGNIEGNISLDLNSGKNFRGVITADITGITLANVENGDSVTLLIEQNGIGGHAIDTTTHANNWTDFAFVNNFSTLDTNPNNWSILNIIYDGTSGSEQYYGSLVVEQTSAIPNSDLANSNIVVNGTTINLGSSGNISNFGTLTTDNLTEGSTNKYFANSLSRTAVSVTQASASGAGTLAYNNGTGVFTYTPPDLTAFGLTNAQAKAFIESTGLDANANISTTGSIIIDYDTGAAGELVLSSSATNKSNIDAVGNFGIQSGGSIYLNSGVYANSIIETTANINVTGGKEVSTGTLRVFDTINAGSLATHTHTFTGNLDVTGNIEVSGNLNYRNVEDLYVRDQSITLNANAATDATVQIIANRPVAGANTVLRWNETDDKWQFSNDGSAYQDLIGLTNLSVTTASASGSGSLAYANTTGIFTFTPPDLSTFSTLTNAQAQAYIQSNGLTQTANISAGSLTIDATDSGTLKFVEDSQLNILSAESYGTQANTNILDFFASGGTAASPAILGNDDRVYHERYTAHDGVSLSSAPQAGMHVFYDRDTDTIGANNVPLAFEWYVNPTVGAGGEFEKSVFKITSDRRVVFNNTGTRRFGNNRGLASVEADGTFHSQQGFSGNSNIITTAGSISGPTLTDTVLSISTGNITNAVNGTYSGTVNAGTFVNGGLTITGANITSAVNIGATGTIDTNGLIKSHGGNVEAAGNVVGVYLHGDGSNISGVSSLTNAQAQSFIQANGLTMTASVTSNSLISTTGNLQVNPNTAVAGLKGLTFDASTNRLGLGTTTPEYGLHIVSDGDIDSQLFMDEYSTSSSASDIRMRRAEGSLSAPRFVNSGDHIGQWYHYGWRENADPTGNASFSDAYGGSFATTGGVEISSFADGDYLVHHLPVGNITSQGGGNPDLLKLTDQTIRFNDGTIFVLDGTTNANLTSLNGKAFYVDQGGGSTTRSYELYYDEDRTLPVQVATGTEDFTNGQANVVSVAQPVGIEFIINDGTTPNRFSTRRITKLRANGEMQFGCSDTDKDGTPTATIDVDGVIETTANITGANITGTYLYGDGTNISGIGGSVNSFESIAVSGGNTVVADSGTDTLNLVAAGAITITADAATDTITIGGTGGTYGNTDVENFLSANVVTANISSQGNLIVNKDLIADNDIKAGNAIFTDSIQTFTGGGTFTMNALRVTDFKANDPLGVASVANTALSGGTFTSPFQGSIAYVINDRHGSRGAPCYFDGTSWRYFSDDANVTI